MFGITSQDGRHRGDTLEQETGPDLERLESMSEPHRISADRRRDRLVNGFDG